MTQKRIRENLSQWLDTNPAKSVEDWYNRKGWLVRTPFPGYSHPKGDLLRIA